MANPDNKESIVVRSLKRLMNLSGIQFPNNIPKSETTSTDVPVSSYTDQELRHMPGWSSDNSKAVLANSTNQIVETLQNVSQHSGSLSREADCLRILTPEIKASSSIMVSSILSPTDLQTDSVQITVDGTDLGAEIEQKCSDLLTAFFNDQLELGPKLERWLDAALYKEGSAAILITPQSNISVLNNAVDEMSSDGVKQKYSKPKIEAGVESLASCETLCNAFSDEALSVLDANIEKDCVDAISSLEGFKDFKDTEIIQASKDVRKAVKQLFTDAKSNVVFTHNPKLINSNNNRLTKTKTDLEKQALSAFIGEGSNPIYILDVNLNKEADENAALIEIPTHAVIPVTVPGSKDKHIGYFVLVDAWGTPLVDKPYDRFSSNGPRKLTEASMQATFGCPTAYHWSNSITDKERFDVTTTIFGVTLKNVLEHKLNSFGLNGITVDERDSISSCLFRYLLEKKKVGFVFVPQAMMTYLAFDYRNDGTGKSLIEDISVLVSLRNVLTIAGILAASENSIDNKVVEIDVDEKNANVQQLLDMVRNAMTEKRMLKFDHHPLAVQRDLIQKSLTILPKNMKGLKESLNVTTDHKSTGAVTPDSNLNEMITKWIITDLETPPAALNQLGDSEYSRSVATTNLFFNNNIKGKQRITCKHINKLIRTYIKYSSGLQKKILNILSATNSSMKNSAEAINDKSTEKNSKIDIKVNEDTAIKNLESVILNTHVSLPTPQIIVDKSQYEEIDKYISSLDGVLNAIFSDDQILDQNYKDMMSMIRSCIKADMVRNYINQIGFQSSYDIPFPKDLDFRDPKELYMYVVNNKKKFINWKKYIADKVLGPNGDGEIQDDGSADSGYGGGDDFGGGNDEFDTDTDTTASSGNQDDVTDIEKDLNATDEEEPTTEESNTNEEDITKDIDKIDTKEKKENPEDIDFDDTPAPPSF